MIDCIKSISKKFSSDQKGVAAIEFAMFFPLLIMLYVGAFQTTKAWKFSQRVSRTAGAISDIIGRQQDVEVNFVKNVAVNVSRSMFQPYPIPSRVNDIKITALRMESTSTPRTLWSWGLNSSSAPYVYLGLGGTTEGATPIPAELMKSGYQSGQYGATDVSNGVFIRTEISYPYKLFGFASNLLPTTVSDYNIKKTIYSRQRTDVRWGTFNSKPVPLMSCVGCPA